MIRFFRYWFAQPHTLTPLYRRVEHAAHALAFIQKLLLVENAFNGKMSFDEATKRMMLVTLQTNSYLKGE